MVREPGIEWSNGFKVDKFTLKEIKGKNWFTNRVADDWNRLISQDNTKARFRIRLDTFKDTSVRPCIILTVSRKLLTLCTST